MLELLVLTVRHKVTEISQNLLLVRLKVIRNGLLLQVEKTY